jgi:hypothetical protein
MSEISESLVNFIAQNHKPNTEEALIFSPDIINCRFNFPFETKNIFNESRNLYEEFFAEVWDNILRGYKFAIMEKQTSNDKKLCSGLMIDFDLYQKSETRVLDSYTFRDIVHAFAKLLLKVLNLPTNLITYAAITGNEAPIAVGDEYKEGFHVLFPGIKLTSHLKQQLYELFENKVKSILGDKFSTTKRCIDMASSAVPVQLYGTIRENKKIPHTIMYMYKIKFTDKVTTEIYKEKEYAYQCATIKTPSQYKLNLCLEFSIHYDGVLIKKKEYMARESMNKELRFNSENFSQLVDPRESTRREVDLLREEYFLASETYNFVAILSPERGAAGNMAGWTQVLRVILNISLKFMPIARLFSMQCDYECWKRGGEEILQELFQKTSNELKLIDETANRAKNMNILKSYAKHDNPEEFVRVNKNTVSMTVAHIISTSAVLTDKCICDLLHNMLGNRFVYVNAKKPGASNNGYWYEYILEDRRDMPRNIKPFVHKWYRHENTPKEIYNTIAEDLSQIFHNLKLFYEKKQGDDKEMKKKLKGSISKIVRGIQYCETISTANSAVTMCQKTRFCDEGFLSEINRDGNILGVGNGLLEFTEEGVIFHEKATYKKITKTTDTFYEPYDANNPYIQEVESVLRDIMPDPKKLDALMMHHAEGMIENLSSHYFVMYYSPGASGKSSIMYLAENAFGMTGKGGYGGDFGYFTLIAATTFTQVKKDVNGVDHNLILLKDVKFVHASEAPAETIVTEVFKNLRDGTPVRELYGHNAPMTFGGIIFYVTNNESGFTSYNIALMRRFLFINFPTVFTHNPIPNSNQKKIDKDIEKKVRYDRNWGRAFLSILVNYWVRMKREKLNMEEILESSGLMQETRDYISKKDDMMCYIVSGLVKSEHGKIHILEFCRRYADWLSEERKKKNIVSYRNYISDARNKFDGKMSMDGDEEFIVGYDFR